MRRGDPSLDTPVATTPGRVRTKLAPEDISYLVLEGGGGKGFAYLGSLGVLDELHVFGHVTGYGGASAGAITAMLLAAGYTVDEIGTFMKKPSSVPGVPIKSFDDFFDLPTPTQRFMPVVGGRYRPVRTSEAEMRLMAALSTSSTLGIGLGTLVRSGFFGPGGLLLHAAVSAQVDEWTAPLTRWLEKNEDKRLVQVLRQNWPAYLAFLVRDMGLFHGQLARDTFDALLGHKVRDDRLEPCRNVTFMQLLKDGPRGAKLLLTGTNLSTGATEIFSPDHTPDFPVADAVRISMSLPLCFKPYVIPGPPRTDWPAPGTYVDGGVWNNLPFREFDDEPLQTSEKQKPGEPERSQTLAIRLDPPEAPAEVEGLFALLGRMGLYGVMGTGESQVTARYVQQTIALDCEGLDLIDFAPTDAVIEKAVARARVTTRKYFATRP